MLIPKLACLVSASNPSRKPGHGEAPLRTKSIGFKVSEEEYAQLEHAAQTSGRTLGERCREVMLTSGRGQSSKATGPGGAEAQALMAELVALRTILLDVLFKVKGVQI